MLKLSAVSTKTSGSLASVTILESSKSSMAEKVLLILEVIANSEFPLTLENISSSIGLAKPTAFRLLNTLVAQGFVERDPNGRRFQPSAKFRLMGLSLLSTDSIRSQRVAVMKRLVEAVGETCNFNILDGNEVLYLDRIETSAPIRLHIDSGMHVPMHCTASGKLFLSFMSDDQIKRIVGAEPLQSYTTKTMIHYSELMAEINKIRVRGYALDNCEYLEGSICVAVPVRESKNKVFAALAAHGPTPRFTLKLAEQSVPILQAAAAELENSLTQ